MKIKLEHAPDPIANLIAWVTEAAKVSSAQTDHLSDDDNVLWEAPGKFMYHCEDIIKTIEANGFEFTEDGKLI